eukprot:11875944-Alexandrium_andersonii.AAC.1
MPAALVFSINGRPRLTPTIRSIIRPRVRGGSCTNSHRHLRGVTRMRSRRHALASSCRIAAPKSS